MVIANLTYIFTFSKFSDNPMYREFKNVKTGVFAILYSLYFTVNSYLIVNYRTTKYYDDQDAACYYAFYVDWTSLFWIDLFRKRKERIQMKRMAQIKNNIEIKKKENN